MSRKDISGGKGRGFREDVSKAGKSGGEKALRQGAAKVEARKKIVVGMRRKV